MRFARFVVLLPLLGCAHRKSDPFEMFSELRTMIPGPLPTDSALLVRLRRDHPCVVRVPRLSRFSDAVSKPMTCTIVQTAVDAIRDLNAASPDILPDLREFRIDRALCVTVKQEAYRDGLTGTIEMARWTVDFTSDDQPDVAVEIHRRTGEARAYKEVDDLDLSAEDYCD